MNKKILVIGFLVLLVLGAGGFFLIKSNKQAGLVTPSLNREKAVPTGKPFQLTKWDDPLGFSFSYPSELKLNPHDEDQENYAHIEITSSTESGKIIVWSSDTEFSNIEDLIKDDPIATNASSLDTNLGGISAKKLYFSQPEKKLMTAAIYDDLLFLVELYPGNGTYWGKIYDELLKNFSFGTMAKSTTNNGEEEVSSGEEGGIDEGEEIIE